MTSVPVDPCDMQRGDIVEWTWSPSVMQMATDGGVRPIGRVVSREDLPFMSVVEGPLNVQCLDDPDWVISPVTVARKGGTFSKVISCERAHAGRPGR